MVWNKYGLWISRQFGFRVPFLASKILLPSAVALIGILFMQGCGGSSGEQHVVAVTNVSVTISPPAISLAAGTRQQFVADVAGATNRAVLWTVTAQNQSSRSGPIAIGTIDSDGVYVAPAVSLDTEVAVTATSVADQNRSATSIVMLYSAQITVLPASLTVPALGTQTFTATSVGSVGTLNWMVNDQPGGNSIVGTITGSGVYTAPSIDPGMPVTISAVSAEDSQLSGTATLAVVNPPTPKLTGATYEKTLRSWVAVLLPRVTDRSGLAWDEGSRTWNPVPGWSAPESGIGDQNIYYLEQFLRPLTRIAIARQDVPLMEELASFHLALLAARTTTIGALINSAPAGATITIDGPLDSRTFAWYQSDGGTVKIQDPVQANSQYLSVAAQLLRAVAEMPAASRTQTLNMFVQQFSHFLVSEQLMRLLYGKTPWSHYGNPNIPQPVVEAWKFLAASGYEPPDPTKYESAMTDMELWLVSDSAEVIGADAAAPDLALLDDDTKSKLKEAVLAGVQLMHTRCKHVVANDGADVISAFGGDYDDHPDYAYSAYTGPDIPVTPSQKTGLGWDISHSYRLPIVFRSLYETRLATGASFPGLNDLVALGNSYVHLAFNGNWQRPNFNNFLDGWDGWFRVGYSTIPGGYTPSQYCDARQEPNNCLGMGAFQGWAQLAFANPDLAKLDQGLVDLAYDDSPATASFKDRHYYYNEVSYSANADVYPWLMVYLLGDSAERLP